MTITLQQIEAVATVIEQTGDWVLANWMRSNAQEIQAQIARAGQCSG